MLMPRLTRLDAPGVLHHVMSRGIERLQKIEADTGLVSRFLRY